MRVYRKSFVWGKNMEFMEYRVICWEIRSKTQEKGIPCFFKRWNSLYRVNRRQNLSGGANIPTLFFEKCEIQSNSRDIPTL